MVAWLVAWWQFGLQDVATAGLAYKTARERDRERDREKDTERKRKK